MSKARECVAFLNLGPATTREVMAALHLDAKQAGNLLNSLRLRSLAEHNKDTGRWQLRDRRHKVPVIRLSAWAVTPALLDQIEASVREIDQFVGSSSDELLSEIKAVREYLG